MLRVPFGGAHASETAAFAKSEDSARRHGRRERSVARASPEIVMREIE